MRNQWKIILILAVFILTSFKVMVTHYKNKLAKVNLELRKEIIKGDSLTIIKDGLYTKLVADTLTKKQLRKKIDSLDLELENPKVITEIVFVPKYIEKEIDGIVVKDSIIDIVDNYPTKESPFVTYKATIDVKKGTGVGSFKFTPIKMDLAIGQNKDGTYKLNTKVPDFISVSSVNVVALPMDTELDPKKDNFGVLFGLGVGTNLDKVYDLYEEDLFFKASVDLRIRKFYIGVEAATNKTVSGGIKVEF
jgi:hypothetical protein